MEWVGHMWWADGSMLKEVLTDRTSENKSRERPQRRWKDSVKELLEEIGAVWERAYNRKQWKESFDGLKD